MTLMAASASTEMLKATTCRLGTGPAIGARRLATSQGIKPKSPKNSTGMVQTNQFRRRRAASQAVHRSTAAPATVKNPMIQFIGPPLVVPAESPKTGQCRFLPRHPNPIDEHHRLVGLDQIDRRLRQPDVRLGDLVYRLWILTAQRQVEDQELRIIVRPAAVAFDQRPPHAVLLLAIDLEHQRVGGPVHRVHVPAGNIATVREMLTAHERRVA